MGTIRIGLALSGGGYRASAFHLGTLSKLNDLGILGKVDVMSTISGGSITGAAWALYHGEYPAFHQMMVEKLRTKNVIHKILFSKWTIALGIASLTMLSVICLLLFTKYAPLSLPIIITLGVIILKYQFRIWPVSKMVEKAYDDFFFDKLTLKSLKAKPHIAIGSSNLHTGRPFTFSQMKMTDSSYIYRSEFDPPIHFNHQEFPIARAVAASACVPFAFSPITIDKKFFNNIEDHGRAEPILVDGGVYDNQGMHKLTQTGSSYECDIIIVSDAGGDFLGNKRYNNTLTLLMRTVDLFMYRIKSAQMTQNIYQNVRKKPVAFISLGWRVETILTGFVHNLAQRNILSEVVAAHELTKEWEAEPKRFEQQIVDHLKSKLSLHGILANELTDEEWMRARHTGTNLTCLSAEQIDRLIRHAQNLTELQVKLYCPMLLMQQTIKL